MRCGVGEILSGDRAYFPLPLAYANDRAPIIPSQIRATVQGLCALARAARRGMGECPSYAPYETEGGGCSNIDPSVNAFEYFRAGGVLSDAGTVGPIGGEEPTLDCPYGTKLNPATGRTECRSQSESLYTTGSGYVQRTSTDPTVMQRIAADAQREGRARGLNITCKMIPLGGDLMNNNQQVYGTDCTVNGTPGHDASVLLTGSGFEIAAVEAGYISGKPVSAIPQFAASSGYQFIPPTSQQSPSAMPVAPVGTMKTPAPQPTPPTTKPPAAPATSVSSGAAQVFSDVSSFAQQAQEAIAGMNIPMWVWYAGGAGVVGYLLMSQSRGGRR